MVLFGKILKELRSSNGATQKQVAEFLGVTTNAYQQFEYDKARPSYENLKKLAEFFSVSTDLLIFGKDDVPLLYRRAIFGSLDALIYVQLKAIADIEGRDVNEQIEHSLRAFIRQYEDLYGMLFTDEITRIKEKLASLPELKEALKKGMTLGLVGRNAQYKQDIKRMSERLKDLILASNLTHEQIALAADIREGNIHDCENGKRLLDSSSLIKLCRFLNVSSDYLLGLSDNPELR